MLVLFFFILKKNKRCVKNKKLPIIYGAIAFSFLFLAYSTYNVYFSFGKFVNDILIILGVIVGCIVFDKFGKEELLKFSLLLFLNCMLTNLIIIFSGFGVSTKVDFLGRGVGLVGGSEAGGMFCFFMLYLLFCLKGYTVQKILLLAINIFITIKTNGYGSMNMLFQFCCIVFLIFMKFMNTNKKKKLLLILSITILVSVIFVISNSVKVLNSKNSQEDDAFSYKLKNITELIKYIDFSDENKIFLIPLSPRVRLLEIINTIKTGNMFTNTFGRGFGGHFRDDFIQFENHAKYYFLSDSDFSLEERKSHNFFTAHNWGYPLLKFGILFFIILFLFTLNQMKKFKKKKDSFGLYLFFIVYLSAISYLGFTFQTSLAIGLLFAVARNHSKVSYNVIFN